MAGNLTVNGRTTTKDLTVTNVPILSAGLAVTNGAWFELRLSTTLYCWIQLYTFVNVTVSSPRGGGFINAASVPLPAKPTGATVTNVGVLPSGGGYAVWPVSGGLANWTVDWQGLASIGGINLPCILLAFGTKP